MVVLVLLSVLLSLHRDATATLPRRYHGGV